jgi:pyridinium-3,5-bisthiocarboxylic acid mononucleotide nickel chelatase
MKIAYFDCFSGASGDMIIGALLDSGLALEALRSELSKLNLSHYHLDVEPAIKGAIGGSKALIAVDQEHHGHYHRKLSDIKKIIEESEIDDAIKAKSIAIFTRLAEAEAKVHRTTIEDVHFHEVGAMDTIVDVVGAVSGLSLLGVEDIYCSAFNVGSGMVQCAHGLLPVPAPATAELISGAPAYASDGKGELLTPTGAAILTTLAAGFGPMPPMRIDTIGYGAGSLETEIPNLLRVTVGEALDKETITRHHPVPSGHSEN